MHGHCKRTRHLTRRGLVAMVTMGLIPLVVGTGPVGAVEQESPPPPTKVTRDTDDPPSASAAPNWDPAPPSDKGHRPESDQPISQEDSADWVQTSDDSVIDAGTLEAQLEGRDQALIAGDGFNAYGSRNYGDYSIVLMSSGEGNIEEFRNELIVAAEGVDSVVGVSMEVAAGTIPGPANPVNLSPDVGEIHVIVSSTSGCSGSNWAGCAGPRGYRSFDGVGHYTGGVVWIHPAVLGYSAASQRHVVEHELGHAFGLQHYDALYNGEYQTMHPSNYPSTLGYRSGDSNGLRWLVDTPPSNDNAADAISVGPDSGSIDVDTWFATREAGEPDHAYSDARRSVWYQYTPTSDQHGGTATLRTVDDGSFGFDTRLAVYSGSMFGAPTLIEQNDDFNGVNSQVSFIVNSNTTYWIAIDGYGWGRGETQLVFDLPVVRPPNDDFGQAFTVGVSDAASGTTVNATAEPNEPQGSHTLPLESVWWRVEGVGSGGWLTASTFGSDFDTELSILSGTSLDSLDEMAYNDDWDGLQSSVGAYLEPGRTYYVRIDGYSDATGLIQLNTSFRRNSNYTPMPPRRLFDSRYGTGGVSSPWTAGDVKSVQLAGGSTGVPSDATAVVVNLTATNASSSGWATVYPVFEDRPTASNLNWRANQNIANQVVVRMSESSQSGGWVNIYNQVGSVDLLADVVGYYSDTVGDRFSSVQPTRILDSRYGNGVSGAFHDGSSRVLQVAGRGGVPYGATAAVLNLTAAESTAGGWAVAYPNGTVRPLASSLNWSAGEIAPNHAIVPLASDGTVRLFTRTSGSVHLVGDVVGWYGPAGSSSYQPLGPVRLLDSRYGIGSWAAPFEPKEARTVAASAVGVPNSATALVVNSTVVGGTRTGYQTVWSAGATRPLASNLNWRADEIRANLVTTPVSGTAYQIWNSSGTSHFVGDVAGFFVP